MNGAITLFIVWLLGKVTGQSYLFLLCLEFGIVGLVISELFKRQLSIGTTVFLGTVSMLFLVAVFLFFLGITEGQEIVDMILGDLQAKINKINEINKQSGLEQEKIDQIKQVFDFYFYWITRLYPAIIIVSTGFLVWLNVIISKPVFLAGKLNYPTFGDTDKWSAPEFLVWGIIGFGFALFLPSTGIRFVAGNILVVLSVIYVFHGLSILLFFFNKYRMPLWARIGIYLLIFLQPIFFIMLAFVGIFDHWADFRKIYKKTDTNQSDGQQI